MNIYIYIFMCAWCFYLATSMRAICIYIYIYLLLSINYSCIRTSFFLFYSAPSLPFYAMYYLKCLKSAPRCGHRY